MPVFDLFISYRRADAPRVRPLVERLRGLGVAVWIDQSEIEDFSAVTAAIKEGIARSRAVLAWYSAIYPLSRPCQWELTAAYLAARQAGDPRQRVLIVNPETSPDHIALPELRDQEYLTPPAIEDLAGYDKLAQGIADQVRTLPGTLGDIRSLVTPAWFPNAPTGSARFVGRLRHMWQIHDALWQGQTVISQLKQGTALAQLAGGGGMGKSLLAEEYALRYGAAYPGGVFWLSARTTAESGAAVCLDQIAQQREQQWRNVAAWLGLEIKDRTLVEIQGALHACFANKNLPFLWVIDDVPSHVPINEELRRWYAPHPLGKTMLTSRSHEYEALGGMVEVGVLEPAEARRLLTSQRPPRDDGESAAVDGILEALGRHALAVDVAAASLKEGSYPEFLVDLKMPDEDALELARDLSGQLPNGHEASIAVTLLQSINAVREETRDFLRLAAVLASAPIARRLVESVFSRADSLGESEARTHAKRALQEAKEQSLAEATGDADFSVTVHVLVTRTMRFRDQRPERRAALRAAAVQTLTGELAEHADDILKHAALANWIDHGRYLVAGLGGDSDLETADLAFWIARFDDVRGSFGAACVLHEKVLEIRRRALGDKHPDTVVSMNNLALLLKTTNRLTEAEPLMRRALAIDEKSYGGDHPNVARDLNNLAALLQATNRLTEAEPLMRRALAINEKSYGGDHPDVAIDLNNLAQLLKATNRLTEAEPLMRRALAIDEKSYGANHPDVARDLNNLAQLLQDTNRLTEAEPMMRRALAIDEKSYGGDHPKVARDLNNLAQLLKATNRLTEAEPLMRRVLEIVLRFMTATGHEHPHLGTAVGNYAELLTAMGHTQEEVRSALHQVMEPFGLLLSE
ncbi:MAG: toll/interleukin-1 receptor domain-containing protein [Desulfobulbaceae bacterium]|nr:toll/interleukin-1 receptor domain-containing protein [Desulfobulbaceae bacterium]